MVLVVGEVGAFVSVEREVVEGEEEMSTDDVEEEVEGLAGRV